MLSALAIRSTSFKCEHLLCDMLASLGVHCLQQVLKGSYSFWLECQDGWAIVVILQGVTQ